MASTYFDNHDICLCSGCGLCVDICPKGCITMERDECGFCYPVIDETKCVHCDLCKKTCSNVNVEYHTNDVLYAAVNKNMEDVQRSASGSMFLVLADYVLKQGGMVAGVKMDDDLRIIHDLTNSREGCYEFCGSKYTKSELNGIYQKVLTQLKEGKKVLFTGTSCQVNAMKLLAKNYADDLITCDVLCHATPSPKVYEMYVKNLEKKFEKKVKAIYFRTKKNGWRNQVPLIVFEDGSEVYEDSYFLAFAREVISRESCYHCVYADTRRISDFTIADMWGFQYLGLNLAKYEKTGISMILPNSDKAKGIFEIIKEQLEYEKVDYKTALSYNHYKNIKPHKNRRKFMDKLANGQINEENIIHYMRIYCGETPINVFIKKIRRRVKKLLFK